MLRCNSEHQCKMHTSPFATVSPIMLGEGAQALSSPRAHVQKVHTSPLYPRQRMQRLLGLAQHLTHEQFCAMLGSAHLSLQTTGSTEIKAPRAVQRTRRTRFLDEGADEGDPLLEYRRWRHMLWITARPIAATAPMPAANANTCIHLHIARAYSEPPASMHAYTAECMH